MKAKADLQMRLAEIKIRGYIKDWEEFVLLYMIMTGQVELPSGALYEASPTEEQHLRGRGLFNPLKKITSPQRDNLVKFAQHFPMLFRPGETPAAVVDRLEDWLDNPDVGDDPKEWMKLIKKGAGGGNLNAFV